MHEETIEYVFIILYAFCQLGYSDVQKIKG